MNVDVCVCVVLISIIVIVPLIWNWRPKPGMIMMKFPREQLIRVRMLAKVRFEVLSTTSKLSW